jgi:excinuclease ABC subunit A
MQKKLDNAGRKQVSWDDRLFSHLKHIEYVDQNPIGRSSRSNPVTYIRLMMTLEIYMQRKNFLK